MFTQAFLQACMVKLQCLDYFLHLAALLRDQWQETFSPVSSVWLPLIKYLLMRFRYEFCEIGYLT
jgi:hypothetical protein